MGELANVLNSFGTFVSTETGILDKLMKEQARTDMLDMQSQLSMKTADFMAELQTSNDYDSWNDRLNKFIETTSNEFQRQSRNNYTAKLAKEMMINASTDLTNKVLFMQLGKAQEGMNVSMNNTLERNRQNIALTGQMFIDEQEKNRRAAMQRGGITEEEYVSGVRQDAVDAFNKNVVMYQQDALKKLDSGMSINEIMDEFDQWNPGDEIKAYAYPGNATEEEIANGKAERKEIAVDFRVAKANAREQTENKLKREQQDRWIENDNRMSAKYNDINMRLQKGAISHVEYGEECDRALQELSELGPNKFAPGKHKSWTDQFITGRKIASGNSGSDKKFINDLIENAPENFVSMYKRGDFPDMYAAVDACKKYVHDKALEHFQGDKEKASNAIEENIAVFNNLANDTVKDMMKSDFAGNGKNAGILKDTLKGLDPEQKAYATGWLCDYLISGPGERNPNEIRQALDNLKSTLTSMKVTTMMLDKKGNTKFKITDDKSYAKGLLQLQENDLVYTDTYGNEVWYGGTDAQKALNQKGGIVPETQSRVAAALGVDVESTSARWKVTSNGTDITNIPIIQVDGKSYEVKSDGKDYKIYEVDPKKNYKEIREVEKPGNAAKNNVKNAQNATADFEEGRYQERLKIATSMEWKDVPKDKNGRPFIDEVAWNQMTPSDRVAQLQNAGYFK